MAEIRNLTRNGQTFYPLTCTDAVLDRNGNPIEIVNDIFDISEYNASGTPLTSKEYASLSLALAEVPGNKQKAGMTVRYIQSSDHKYQQYRLMANDWSTTVSDWQGVDEVPEYNSCNLVESKGTFNELFSTTTIVDKNIIVESGSLDSSTGEEKSIVGRARSGFLKVDGKFQLLTNFNYNIFYYNTYDHQFDHNEGSTWISSGRNSYTYYGYVRLVFDLQGHDISEVESYIRSSAFTNRITILEENIFLKQFIVTENGSITTADGSELNISGRQRSDYIRVKGQFSIYSNCPYNIFYYASNSLPMDYFEASTWIQAGSGRYSYNGYIRIIYNIENLQDLFVNSYIESGKINEIDEIIYTSNLSLNTMNQIGSISTSTGQETDSNNVARTNYIKVEGEFEITTNMPFNIFYFNYEQSYKFCQSNNWISAGTYTYNYKGYIRVLYNFSNYGLNSIDSKIRASFDLKTLVENKSYLNPSLNKTMTFSFGINNNILGLNWDQSQLEDTSVLTKSVSGIIFPSSYTSTGNKTKVIAMFHGHGGYVDNSCLGYTNASWTAWRNVYLSAGYAVMDINGYGEYNNDNTNRPWGNSGSIQTINKTFEYLKTNYNIEDKLYLHGYSMGGQNAISYAMNKPSDVAAILAFEPAFPNLVTRQDLISTSAAAFGYSTQSEMENDNYQRMVGYSLPLSVQVFDSNGAIEPNGNLNLNWEILTTKYLIAKISCPIRIYQGTVGDVINPNINKNLINALRNGGCNASIRMVNGANHDFFGSSSQEWIRNESLYFFNRF